MAGAVDMFMVYQFIRRLVTPFEKWKAFETGVIDKDGKVIVDKRDRDQEQKKSWGYFDRLIANLKKLLAKVPGGQSRLGSFAAALLLIREHNLDPNDTAYLEECLDHYMKEAQTLTEEMGVSAVPTVAVGNDKIAGMGTDQPPVSKKKQKKHKKSNSVASRTKDEVKIL